MSNGLRRLMARRVKADVCVHVLRSFKAPKRTTPAWRGPVFDPIAMGEPALYLAYPERWKWRLCVHQFQNITPLVRLSRIGTTHYSSEKFRTYPVAEVATDLLWPEAWATFCTYARML
jgi:hypothetical protein